MFIQLPSFSDWLREQVQAMIDYEEDVDMEQVQMPTLPSQVAEEYPSMWAYWNHFCCLPDNKSVIQACMSCHHRIAGLQLMIETI